MIWCCFCLVAHPLRAQLDAILKNSTETQAEADQQLADLKNTLETLKAKTGAARTRRRSKSPSKGADAAKMGKAPAAAAADSSAPAAEAAAPAQEVVSVTSGSKDAGSQ